MKTKFYIRIQQTLTNYKTGFLEKQRIEVTLQRTRSEKDVIAITYLSSNDTMKYAWKFNCE